MIELIMICSIVIGGYSNYTVGKLTDITATKHGVMYLVTGVSFNTDGDSTRNGYYYGPDCKFVK